MFIHMHPHPCLNCTPHQQISLLRLFCTGDELHPHSPYSQIKGFISKDNSPFSSNQKLCFYSSKSQLLYCPCPH